MLRQLEVGGVLCYWQEQRTQPNSVVQRDSVVQPNSVVQRDSVVQRTYRRIINREDLCRTLKALRSKHSLITYHFHEENIHCF